MRYTVENTSKRGIEVKVYVNGNLIENAFIADTTRGEVWYYPKPLRLHKNRKDEVYARRLKGVVTVEFL